MPYGFTDSKVASEAAKKQKRGKARSTIIKEMLASTEEFENVDELKKAILQVAAEMLEAKSKEDRKFALKELSKYVFTTKEQKNITFEDLLD